MCSGVKMVIQPHNIYTLTASLTIFVQSHWSRLCCIRLFKFVIITLHYITRLFRKVCTNCIDLFAVHLHFMYQLHKCITFAPWWAEQYEWYWHVQQQCQVLPDHADRAWQNRSGTAARLSFLNRMLAATSCLHPTNYADNCMCANISALQLK